MVTLFVNPAVWTPLGWSLTWPLPLMVLATVRFRSVPVVPLPLSSTVNVPPGFTWMALVPRPRPAMAPVAVPVCFIKSSPPLIAVAPFTVLFPVSETAPVKVLSSVIAPTVSPVAVVTLFAGEPVKSASLPLAKVVSVPSLSQLEVVATSHRPLVVPVQVSVAA